MKRTLLAALVLAAFFFGWWNCSLSVVPLAREVRNQAGSFRLAKPASVPRTESGGAVWGDRFYLLGGLDAWTRSLTSFIVYDPSSDSWSKLPDLPQRINHPAVVATDGKIYVLGGCGPLGIRVHGFMFARWRPLNTVYIFDIQKNTWKEGPPMPVRRGTGAAAVAEGMIWYVGGINEALLDSADLFRLDLSSGRWQKMAPMPTARDHLRLEAVEGRLYAISGRKDDLRYNYSTTESYDIASDLWRRVADIPKGRGGMASVVKDGFIYTFGGEYVWTCLDLIERYDAANDRWETLGRLPEGRHGIIAGVMSDGIHLVSGGRHPRASISGIHRVFEPNPA